jgi:hypothetical protein
LIVVVENLEASGIGSNSTYINVMHSIEISIIYICSERETQMEPHLKPMMAMRRGGCYDRN